MTTFDQAPKDAPPMFTIELPEGNTLYMERRNPYGHIYFRLAHGTLPEKYQGVYTNFDKARLSAGEYIQEREKAKEALVTEKITLRKKLSG